MDEEKSVSSGQETVFSKEYDQIDSSAELNVPSMEVDDFVTQESMKVDKEAVSVQKEVDQESTVDIVPILLNSNKEKAEHNTLEECISINQPTTKISTSLTDLSGTSLSKFQISSSDTDLPQEDIQESSSYRNTSLSLPILHDLVSCKPLNVNSSNITESIALKEAINVSQTCNNEQKTLFNDQLHGNTCQATFLEESTNIDEHQNYRRHNSSKTIEDEKQSFKLDNKLVLDIYQREDSKNERESEVPLCSTEEQKSVPTARNTKLLADYPSRPTLIDDSKLVKISLPTNPINLMQSNAQFLNKSRNFLNFITEKSTNIMEKALLPQQLTVKYNSMMKSIDNTHGDRKYVDEHYAGKENCSTNSVSNFDSCSVEKFKNTSSTSNGSVILKKEKTESPFDCTTDYESITRVNTEKNELVLSSINDSMNGTLSEGNNATCNSDIHVLGQIAGTTELDCASNNDSTTNDITYLVKANGNAEEHQVQIENMHEEEQQDIDVKGLKQSLLQHPAYLTLLRDYTDLKTRSLKLQKNVDILEEKNRTLEAEKTGEIFTAQIETLEKTVDKLTSELRASVAAQEILKKDYNAANKERESMVMKYAVGEKQLIDTQRARESAERKVKELVKEQELLQNKLRQAQGERTRICNILDKKCCEVTDLQKEVEKFKEDVSLKDVKLKWTQNKLKMEMDLQKETQLKLEKATAKINVMKEECDQVRKETQESMRKFQLSEENKAVTLDQQLKEQQARLILERHVIEDKEMLRLQLQKEVEVLKHRQQILIEENNTLSLKIQDSERNRLNYESNLSNLKIIADQRQKEIVDLLSKVFELETVKLQLQHKDQCLASAEGEMENLRSTNEELQSEMSACRQREADMLDFTQKLTDKNLRLQLEFTAIEAKTKELEEEHGPLHERISELCGKIKILEGNLAQEQKARSEECDILARHLVEQTQLAQNLVQKLEDSQGENVVLRRKQQISMKEMTRELQQCRKRLEAFEAASPCNSLDVASQTDSNVSLNTGDALNGALSDNSANGDQTIQFAEPSKQALIDRIIKLQEINVKRAEKVDFLEEHSRALVEELQKKTRIIQNYSFHENFDAMGSNERDRHKAELARHGGIMASVYNQRVSDDNMTLELSLEINQKLQAALEETLLKNMTLKDNIDTLGEEIARLTMRNQQKQVAN